MSDLITISIDSKQTFKAGIRDMVCSAMDAGGKAVLQNCTMTTAAGVKVSFSVTVEIEDVESINPGEIVMTAAQVRGD